jgi:hypothetical protein
MATQPLTSHDTTATPVNRLDGALVHLGDVVAQLEQDATLDRGRLGRAIMVLLTSDIVESAECGVYEVQSACEPSTWYLATTLVCTCPDTVRHGGPCKHSLALTILSAVSAIQARERAAACASARHRGPCDDALDLDPDAPIPYVLTARALAALAAPTVASDTTSPQTAAQAQHGPLSGEAACPRCGRVRGAVFDGTSHRCYGCWHAWVPEPAPIVA